MLHIDCPFCAIEMKYAGVEVTADGVNEVYECPNCGTRQRRWLLDTEPEGGE